MLNIINKKVRYIACLLLLVLVVSVFPAAAFAAESLPEIKGNSAILVDAETGYVLYEQNADEIILPASTTKILTAMLVVEAVRDGRITMQDKVTAKQELIDGVMFDASKVSPYISDGEILTVEEYLYCVMLGSDCVACDILAEYVSGSVEAFVRQMNERAAELGCKNFCFLNTHGYPEEGHYATARTLSIITRAAIQYPEFRTIFGTIKKSLPETNLGSNRMLYNTNWTIWNPEKITSIYCKYYYEFATGGKTGSSSKSGHCLASTAHKDGRTLVCVITGAKIETDPETQESLNRSFTETARLYEWGFKNFSVRELAHAGDIVGYMPVSGGDVDNVNLRVEQAVSVFVDNEISVDDLERSIVTKEYINAPVSSGDVAGELVVSDNKGNVIARVPLVCAEDVALKPKGAGLIWFAVTLLIIGGAAALFYYYETKDPKGAAEFKRKVKLTVEEFIPPEYTAQVKEKIKNLIKPNEPANRR